MDNFEALEKDMELLKDDITKQIIKSEKNIISRIDKSKQLMEWIHNNEIELDEIIKDSTSFQMMIGHAEMKFNLSIENKEHYYFILGIKWAINQATEHLKNK